MNLLEKTKIPDDFRRCVVSGCAAAETCLRHVAYEESTEAVESFWVINPKAAHPIESSTHSEGTETICPHYCSAAKVRMARGFKLALLSVPHGNVKRVCDEISQHFCQRNYYHMRRGDRPMTPGEQQFIAEVLERNGAHTPIQFDVYYDDFLWI